MKHPNANIFAAWFFMFQTLAMGWVAATGNILLQLLNQPTHEGDVPGRIVGALLLLLIVYLASHFLHGLPPHGKAEGNGFKPGHRILLAGNILASLLFVFHLFATGIDSYNTHLVLHTFTTSFGYFAMGCFAIGFSLVYQSSLPQEQEKNS
jgi:hypothetical protein